MHRFDDAYLFNWMKTKTPLVPVHISYRSFLDIPTYRRVIYSLSPGFLSHFKDYQKKISFAFRRRMKRQIPRWYWTRLRHCADYYVRFFSCIWPEHAAIVKDLIYVEWLLYVEPEYMEYRDHLLHMFKVACLGTWMLSQNDFIKQIVSMQFGETGNAANQPPEHFQKWMEQQNIRLNNLNQGQKENIILWAFLLASLFHDIGYGYFHRTLYDKKVERMYCWLSSLSQNSEPLCKCYQGWTNSLTGAFIKVNLAKTNLDASVINRRLTGFIRNTLTLNHSAASCLFTLHLKNMLKDARAMNPHLNLAIEIAAEAILLHDMIKKGNWCGINKNTLNPDSYKRTH